MSLALSDERRSYVHGASDVPLIGAPIGDLFDRVVAQVPENEALVSEVRPLFALWQSLAMQGISGIPHERKVSSYSVWYEFAYTVLCLRRQLGNG